MVNCLKTTNILYTCSF